MKGLLTILGCLLLIAVGIHWARWQREQLAHFPHAFLSAAGYDESAVEVVFAPLIHPPSPPDGLLPAWICRDPAFADPSGQLWLFPLAVEDNRMPVPPRHPRLGRAPALDACERYYTAEGRQLLSDYTASRSAKP